MSMLAVGLSALLFVFQASAQQQGGPPPNPDAIAADTGAMKHANHRTPPLAHALRVPANSAMHIDGRLDEAAWAQARPVTQFSQSQPREGEPATERSDVRVLFDDNAVYVGAKLYDSDPSGIRRQLARRDASTEADLFEVALDS